MGFLTHFIIAVIAVFVYIRVLNFNNSAGLSVNFGGTWEKEFEDVVDVFRRNVESGKEQGGAFAVYYKGKPVIDIWGGYADAASYRPWQRDTTSLVYSCTKGVAAIVIAKMVEEGSLDYGRLVTDYWPEFGANGKDNVTVEMLISHQAGLAYLDTQLSVYEYKTDREKWSRVLAEQKPAWPPGAHFGYHALTFGLYVDELIQRADPQHRDTATIFKHMIAEPFDIDFGMSTPREEFYRSARLLTKTKIQLLIDSFTHRRYLKPLYQLVFEPDAPFARSIAPIKEYAESSDCVNNPYIREVTVSSFSGTGTARGLARMYGILANGGSDGGKTLLSPAAIKTLATPVVYGADYVMITGEQTSIGRGTMYLTNPKGQKTVGHTGFGGQVAVGDLENGLGIAYLTNHLTIHGIADDPRFLDVQQALYKTLDKITK